MSVISALRPLATGMDTAIQGLKRGQDRLAAAASTVARQGASIGESSTRQTGASRPPGLTPPNPGPPGGAVPGDLAQAMSAQRGDFSADTGSDDLISAMVEQVGAKVEITANIKTLQAFDEMLQELTRMKT
jgi:hypothetical protein